MISKRKFYHGTISSLVPDILREGIIPGGHCRNWNEWLPWRRKAVFLADNVALANWYGWAMIERNLSAIDDIAVIAIDVPQDICVVKDNRCISSKGKAFYKKGKIPVNWISEINIGGDIIWQK